MSDWIKVLPDEWLQAANLRAGRLFRRVNKNGKAWGDGLRETAVWHAVREYARQAGIDNTLGAHCVICEGVRRQWVNTAPMPIKSASIVCARSRELSDINRPLHSWHKRRIAAAKLRLADGF